jgi:HK97 gp10 family phage protein
MGEVVVQQIKSETPVITGNLRDGNEYEVHSQTLFVRNLVEYAKFVELGTYKQHSNPFMRRGIMNSKSKMLQILLKKCKV